MKRLQLRDYQQQAVEAIREAKNKGISRQLIVLPTGVGKTIVMAAIASLFGMKVLLLAHRDELINQAKDKFLLYAPHMDIGICKTKKNEIDKRIVIGSVQSCSKPKRLQELKEKNFSILMIDEAHHAESASYQKIIQELGFNGPNKLLIGVTATPIRADKKQLGNTFDEIVFSRSIGDMIKNNYLPPIVGRRCLTSCSLKGIKSKHGDFIASQLSHAINNDTRNQFVVDKYKEHASDRKAIAFCVDVKHAKDLAAMFNKSGITSEAVWGAMPKEERKKTLENFRNGTISVLTSCELLTEGFDEKTVDAVLMARPTKSKSLYIQMVGRGTRKHHSKENCLVLDFTDERNNLSNVITLEQAIPEAQIIPLQHKKKEQEKTARNFSDEQRKDIDQEFDILGGISYAWVENGFDELSLMDDNGNEIVIQKMKDGFVADIFYTNRSTGCIVSKPLPLEYCIGVCEDFARRFLNIKIADKNAEWMNSDAPPTPNQMRFLKKKRWAQKVYTKTNAYIAIRAIVAHDKKKLRLKKEAQWTNTNI